LSLELALAEVLDAPNGPTPLPSVPPPSAAVHAQPQPAPVSQTESPPRPAQSDSVEEEKTSAISKEEPQMPRPAEKSAISAAEVIKAWKNLASSLPKSQANLSALLNSVKMIDVQGKTLILGLASDVLVSKINNPDQIEAIQKLVRDELSGMDIRCVVTTVKARSHERAPGRNGGYHQHGGCGYVIMLRSPSPANSEI
jgi:hypothetical protein